MYYVMTCEGEYPSAARGERPSLGMAPWYSGRRLRVAVPGPLVYGLDPTRPGNIRSMYEEESYPLMSDALAEALRAAGVDNLDLYTTIIRDPETGSERSDYKAFNIVGAVAAADLSKSVLMGTSDSDMIDVDFESLAVDTNAMPGLLMFRLAESVNAIIVHRAVRDEIERRNIPGMVFYDPEDWSG
jgi:hypothetical protein